MYTILIVEDEPAAMRYLKTLIALKCPSFSVVATAEDGMEALSAARSCSPDLIITDIRMAGMGGLELVDNLKSEFLDTPVVIASGYREFEYARRALDTGVVEYLLKPVNPEKLAETLDALVPRLEMKRKKNEEAAIYSLLQGDAPMGTEASEQERSELFRVAVAKFGGPMARQEEGKEADHFTFIGKDETERIFLVPKRRMSSDEFAARVASVMGRMTTSYSTVRVLAKGVVGSDLEREIRELRKELEKAIVIGVSQVLLAPPPEQKTYELDLVTRDRLAYALANSRYGEIEGILRELADSWRERKLPLPYAKAALRMVLGLIAVSDADTDYQLDLLLSEARGWDDVAAGVWSLASSLLSLEQEAGNDEAPAFFRRICRHIDTRYAESLTLTDLCEAFHISRPYMYKLFRKFEGTSFNEYLTRRRIEAAKRLIAESPSMPLKDVAQYVGYQDQFYFSRVFKSLTGIPPSEYR